MKQVFLLVSKLPLTLNFIKAQVLLLLSDCVDLWIVSQTIQKLLIKPQFSLIKQSKLHFSPIVYDIRNSRSFWKNEWMICFLPVESWKKIFSFSCWPELGARWPCFSSFLDSSLLQLKPAEELTEWGHTTLRSTARRLLWRQQLTADSLLTRKH